MLQVQLLHFCLHAFRTPFQAGLDGVSWQAALPSWMVCLSQVQYPDAQKTMEMDLKNIRTAAWYLTKTELQVCRVASTQC